MSGGGFGICGHKNQFSTRVRVGNWVEDTVGGVLGKQHLRAGPASFGNAKSETQHHYDDRVTKAMQAGEKFSTGDSTDQLIALRGLPNNLLFGHEGDYTAETRYKTTAEAANSTHAPKFGRNSREKLTRKKLISDKNQATANPFETQAGRSTREMFIRASTQEKVDFKPPEGDKTNEWLAEVPKERRHTTFVSQFNAGIRGLRS